jgi:hypothetical protein
LLKGGGVELPAKDREKERKRVCNKWVKTTSYENGVSVGGSIKCES